MRVVQDAFGWGDLSNAALIVEEVGSILQGVRTSGIKELHCVFDILLVGCYVVPSTEKANLNLDATEFQDKAVKIQQASQGKEETYKDQWLARQRQTQNSLKRGHMCL
ncbi:hypothetical protein E2C01_056598 [Portunus trituberculatus]|uniref:Uncharacterized protein n=1 Tax=Portunus trituberculatus TaxID=210409 RepID=A0A5B7GXV2_PORTR|nr:hypothetical protein [Portunus trituberculatus]